MKFSEHVGFYFFKLLLLVPGYLVALACCILASRHGYLSQSIGVYAIVLGIITVIAAFFLHGDKADLGDV